MIEELLARYLDGPRQLREAVAGLTAEELRARPVAGQWSTLEVVCHIADFEPVYADRMKRVIAEDRPHMPGGDPDVFAAKLAYEARDLEEELALIEAVRRHVSRILRTLPAEAFELVGLHARDGELSLRTLLERITGHVPHHVAFIDRKRAALGVPRATAAP